RLELAMTHGLHVDSEGHITETFVLCFTTDCAPGGMRGLHQTGNNFRNSTSL
ncbi:Photosynthetic reaction center cytochrome c subunit, partial [Dissostichus eleginoides]